MVALLLCLSLCATLLSARYFFSLKELQSLQAQYYRVNQILTATRSLATYCKQYGQSNPDINPIVDQFIQKLRLQPDTNVLSELSPPESTVSTNSP